MSDKIVTINEVHFHPEEGMFHGAGDDGTVYILKVADAELESLRARDGQLTERRCPRCDFEDAICSLVYAGEYIHEHYEPDQLGQLNDVERAIVDAGRSWMADDAITRCLAEEQGA